MPLRSFSSYAPSSLYVEYINTEMIAEGPERIWRAWDFADDGTPVTVEFRFRHTQDGGLVILELKTTPRENPTNA